MTVGNNRANTQSRFANIAHIRTPRDLSLQQHKPLAVMLSVYLSVSNMLHVMLQTMSDNPSQLPGKIHPLVSCWFRICPRL